MNEKSPKIFLLPFPQQLDVDTATLRCNLLVMPRFKPTNPLALAPQPLASFAVGPLNLRAIVFKGDAQGLPARKDIPGDAIIIPNIVGLETDRTALFNTIGSHFTIADDKHRTFNQGSIYKYLSPGYRNAFNFTKAATPFAKTDDSYFCMLKQVTPTNDPYVPDNTVNWAQVMAFCLQHKELARQLGLLHLDLSISVGDAAFFKDGGWVFFEFEDTGEVTTFDKLNEEDLQRYAAYIPATTTSRPLFAPVIFPLVSSGGTQNFDGAFRDLVHYDDGFARIVHASQAISIDQLAEKYEGNPPVMDTGIRLGWDEEQILIWLNNSMKAKTPPPPGIDLVPGPVLGVGRYRVDVALKDGEPAADDETRLDWKSQVSVIAAPASLDGIPLDGFEGELGIEVAPVKHKGSKDFWLPVYFTNWDGTSLCVRDAQAEAIRQMAQHEAKLNKDLALIPEPPISAAGLYTPDPQDQLLLKYGKRYAFRVRLSDLTGGGPLKVNKSINAGENKIAYCDFKRHVAPQPPVITKLNETSLQISRARLTYPAITFTGEDKATVLTELKADMDALEAIYAEIRVEQGKPAPDVQKINALRIAVSREPSLPDPDVDKIGIVVEVKTLDMDVEASYNAVNKAYPKEPFLYLYTTTRDYPAYRLEHARADDLIQLDLDFQEIPVLDLKNPLTLGLAGDLFLGEGPLILPAGREVRLTIRSYCKKPDNVYFAADDYRFSLPAKTIVRKDPVRVEPAVLLAAPAGIDPLVSFYFRPVPKPTPQQLKATATGGNGTQIATDILESLAAETSLSCRDLSISGKENIRTQFGCSSQLGYTLSPDASSITFSGKEELQLKWINVVQFQLQRDWSWDLLLPAGFKVFRRWRFASDPEVLSAKKLERVGYIPLCKGLNWQKMSDPDRSGTRLVFIDALDPKQEGIKTFPDLVEVAYYLSPQLMPGMEAIPSPEEADVEPDVVTDLPITTPPKQVPRIVSVGLALTPEDKEETLFNNQYSETSQRRRYLWVEFAEPVADPNDAYFARVLAYAADPMLADLPVNPDPASEKPEPALDIPAEVVRSIRPKQIRDQSGLEAMPLMIPAQVAGDSAAVHYLVPLPDNLSPESIELFGFFKYEMAVGHLKQWCTAQARYGRPLPVTGLQHPAPAMQLSVLRENDAILVSTAYAGSYQDGRNCTPQRPRTDIYALLYAQVMQVDGRQFRNVLISQQLLRKPMYISDPESRLKERILQERVQFAIEGEARPYVLAPGDLPLGNTVWRMKAVRQLLLRLGIDINAPLSVMAIELMPPNDHADYINSRQIDPALAVQGEQALALDKVRILRTSRLCKVADSCPVL
jgi:hypothetical protein